MKRSVLLIFFCIGILSFSSAQEICNNGIDDDGDLLIDLNDSVECFCSIEKKYDFISSIIPNPSFELMDSCPTWDSQVDRATGWKQATNATSDYFVRGCPYNQSDIFRHPVPDGNAFVGGAISKGFQEYVGSCLLSPMLAGTEYTMQFNIAMFATDGGVDTLRKKTFGPIDMTIFGFPTCPQFPVFADSAKLNDLFLCPQDQGWKEIGKVTYIPDSNWSIATIVFTPVFDVGAIMLGSPCTLPADYPLAWNSEDIYAYALFDNLILNKSSIFVASQVIDSSGSVCRNNLKLTAHPTPASGLYQWYKEGVALAGETDTIIALSSKGYGVGKYTFVLTLDSVLHNCSVSSFIVDAPQYSTITAFSVNDPDNCKPHTAMFTGSGSLNASCRWNFGDGDSAAICNPSHKFQTAGIFDVKFSVISPQGCITDTVISSMVTVYDTPGISYSIDDRDGCYPHTVNITNNSTLSAFCSWTFGDGSTSNKCNPSHTYSTSGVYEGKLTITSPNGCIKDSVISAMVEVYNHPLVNYSVSNVNNCVNAPINFINTSTLANSCFWDFGDGTSSNNCNPSHTYAAQGNYAITLSVTSANGCVHDTTYSQLLAVNATPDAAFDTIAAGCSPLNATLQNTSSGASSYLWTFSLGNPSFSTDINPTVELINNGNANSFYKVELIATNNGCSDTAFQNVLVYNTPIADFSFTPSNYFLPSNDPVTFSNQSVNANTYAWSFGDGSTSAEKNPSYSYSTVGNYPIILIASNSMNCKDTLEKSITVKERGSIEFPTAFIPNKEGSNGGKYDIADIKNDVFFPKYKSISKYHLMIFNRWGELIFESTDINTGWDGYYKETICQADVYVWKVEVVFEDKEGDVYQKSGAVTLLR